MFSDLLIRIRSIFRRNQVEDEMNAELSFHFEHEVARQIAQGATPEEAAKQARLIFGGLEQVREDCRQARGVSLIENFGQDVRYAFRMLRRSPAFAASAVITLALGIGATTVVFSVVDVVLLNPVPFRDSERLVEFYTYGKTGGGPRQPAAMLTGWRDQTQLFEQVEAYWRRSLALTSGGEPRVINGAQVTTGLFGFLGVRPEIGRDFASDEASAPLAVISHELWTSRYASDPKIIGASVRLNDDTFTVVGVMPSWFRFPAPTVHVWTPFDPTNRSADSITPVARLRPGIPLEQADAQVAALALRLDPTLAGVTTRTARLMPMNRFATNSFQVARSRILQVRSKLFFLLGAAALVLLASCVNSANLFLSRALSRTREMGIRAAIGGGRLRLAAHMLTEAGVVSLIAGVIGIVLADWCLRGLAFRMPEATLGTTLRPLTLDMRVALMTVGSSIVAGVAAAILPTLRASSFTDSVAMRGRSDIGSHREVRLRGLMISIETALAMMLVVGAGLMARTLWTLTHVDTGFAKERVVVIEPQFRGSRYNNIAGRGDLMNRLSLDLRGVPGIQSVSIADQLPLLPNSFTFGTIETSTGMFPESMLTIGRVEESYFMTLGIPVSAGRAVTPSDDPRSAVISHRLAQRLWPDGNPLGQRFRLKPDFDWLTVVGVAGDVQSERFDFREDPREVYLPLTEPSSMRFLAVRVDASSDISSLLHSRIRQLDPNLPVNIVSLADAYTDTLKEPIFHGMLLSGCALLTVLLAIAGVFAVVTYEVSRRTEEIGIRVALGATRVGVTLQVMKRSIVLAVIGIVVGMSASLALTKFMSSMLYEVTPTDPLTFVVAPVVLVTIVILAGYLPGRRVARIDPACALRND